MNVKQESENAVLKFIIHKPKTMVSCPTIHSKWMEKKLKQWYILFWGALKSLQMVTVFAKLKCIFSLHKKLWPN